MELISGQMYKGDKRGSSEVGLSTVLRSRVATCSFPPDDKRPRHVGHQRGRIFGGKDAR